MQQLTHERAGQISGGVFLIGVGLMLFGILPWFPGILYVLGVTALVNGLVPDSGGKGALQGGLFLIGLGLVFSVGFWLLPLLVILLGIGLLTGKINGAAFSRGDSSQRRAQREAWREQARALKSEYRAQRHALKDQYRYGSSYVPPDKMKNDQFDNDPDAGESEDEEYTLGDDGELIKTKNDQRRPGATDRQ